jgi:Ca2+-binding RTX toxin-like protein
MFGFNTYYATDNAKAYVDRLFGSSSQSQAGPEEARLRPANTPTDGAMSARDRAMSNIISIIWRMEHGGEESQSQVNESGGYVLDATGTEDGDKIDMKAISAFNIDTGAGDDTVTLKAQSLGGLVAGEGDDGLNIAAAYIADIDGGDGDDKIQVAGELADSISGGAGADTLKISAKTILGADGGAGDDTLYLEGNRIFASGGTGNDTITINNTGDRAAELSFLSGDGDDTVNVNGPLDIRFGVGAYGRLPEDRSATGFAPDDLDITVLNDKLVIHSLTSEDSITINFDRGALGDSKPAFEFVMDQGDFVLKIR